VGEVTGPLEFAAPLTIGVLADTHIYPRGRRRLPPEVPALFERAGVGLILHAGDINDQVLLDDLAGIAPILAVVGNNDSAELADRLPERIEFQVGQFRFLLIHGHQGRTARAVARTFAGRVDCVIYGHSHIPKIEVQNGTTLFNPGSPTDRRWQPHFGVGLIQVEAERCRPELVLFADPADLRSVDGPATAYTGA
jgi:putative phosphoesterase